MSSNESLERARAYFSRMSLEDWQTRQAGARALWAVRVLDAYTRKHAYPFGENDHTVKCSGTGDVWRVLLGSWEFPAASTPDGARIAAAEALVEEDPSLGEGL